MDDGQLGLGAAAHDRRHPVAVLEAGHAGAGGDDLTGQLEAGDVGGAPGRRRIQALDLHRIGGVDARGPNPDEELSLGRLGVGVLPDLDPPVHDGDRSHRRSVRSFAPARPSSPELARTKRSERGR